MRVPNFDRNPTFLQMIGLLLCGMLIGGALMTALAQRNAQEMQNAINRLENDNKTYKEQLANYEKVRNQRNVIAKTTIEWDTRQKPFEQSVLNSLKEQISDDVKVVIGNPLHPDLPAVYRSLIDGKIYYDINGKNYRVRLQMLAILASECVFYVQAEEFIAN